MTFKGITFIHAEMAEQLFLDVAKKMRAGRIIGNTKKLTSECEKGRIILPCDNY